MPLSPRGVRSILLSSLTMIGCSQPANSVEQSSQNLLERDTQQMPTQTACGEGETTFFSCGTSAGGNVAVCGTNVDNNPSLTYEYNDGRNTVIRHHWDKESGAEGRFTQNSYHRYRTEYNEIGFALADKEYKIFSHYDAENGVEKFSRGVRIQDLESGDEIDSLVCADTQADDIKQLLTNLECDRDSALGCAD